MGINPLNKQASASQDRYMESIRNAESEKKAKEAKAKAEAERAERRKQAQANAKPEQKAATMTTEAYMADVYGKLRFAEGTAREKLLKEARSRLTIRDYWKLMQELHSQPSHRAEFY